MLQESFLFALRQIITQFSNCLEKQANSFCILSKSIGHVRTLVKAARCSQHSVRSLRYTWSPAAKPPHQPDSWGGKSACHTSSKDRGSSCGACPSLACTKNVNISRNKLLSL